MIGAYKRTYICACMFLTMGKEILSVFMTYRMENVQLPPFKRRFGSILGIGSSGLNALDMANMLNGVCRAVARIIATTSQRHRKQSSEPTDNNGKNLHGVSETRTDR
jgi:hypothetical protein